MLDQVLDLEQRWPPLIGTGFQQAEPWPRAPSASRAASRRRSAACCGRSGRRNEAARRALAGRRHRAGNGRAARPRRRSEPRHRGEQARPCRDGAAARTGSSTGACSTIRPAYITATSSHISATTPRSWVIRRIAMPSSSRRPRSSSRICAWTVTSSAVVGSSAISRLGLAGQRHRDHHPLAHAARQLDADTARGGAPARRCRPCAAARAPARADAARRQVACAGAALSLDLVADRSRSG